MRENLSKSKFISTFEELKKLLEDETLEVQGVRLVSDATVQAIYKTKENDLLQMSADTNIYVAVATTGWARMRLYEELDFLKDRILYCDTDSVIYRRSDNPAENLRIGKFLGDMTDELDADDAIVEFVSGGPKNYAYRTRNGKMVVKVKGFTLNAVNATAFSFENLKQVILGGVRTCEDVGQETSEEIGKRKKIVPKEQRMLRTTELREEFMKEHLAQEGASAVAGERGISVFNPTRIFRTRDWRMLKKEDQKLYTFCFDKRIVLSNLDTVPFGYVGKLG